MTDEDLLHDRPNPEFGSGIIGVCDVCGRRQAVIVLQKERFQLCVLDFLNKTWATSGRPPGAPLPPYRSERVWFPTRSDPEGRAPAVSLSPTKAVKHPVVLITPDVYGLTTSLLDGAIRFAREGFEVLLPDLGRMSGVGPSTHLSMRMGRRSTGGVRSDGKRIAPLVALYRDALAYAKTRELADPSKCAVFGLSYGGSLATIVATQEPSISAVALAYPVPVRPPSLLRALGAPTLVVTGANDAAARIFVEELRGATSGVPRPPEFLEAPGVGPQFLARDLPGYDLAAAEAAWTRILAFLRLQLLPPPPRPATPPVMKPPASPAVASAAGPTSTAAGPSPTPRAPTAAAPA